MNKIEEQFYAMAAHEIASKSVAPGVMAKALVDADGDEKKTILNYIRLRVAQLKEEFEAERIRRAQDEAERQKMERAERQRRARAPGAAAQSKVESHRQAARSEFGPLYDKLVASYGSRLEPSQFESTSQYLARVIHFLREFERGR